MKKVIDTCELLQENCPDNEHKLFQPLTVAIHTYYSRPFKGTQFKGRKDTSKVSSDIVPDSLGAGHRFLIDWRDTATNHIDASYCDLAGRPKNDVRYHIIDGRRVITTGSPLHVVEDYCRVPDHCRLMTDVFADRIRKLEIRFEHLFPRVDGDYVLSHEDDLALFIEAKPSPSRSTMTYK